MATQTERPRFYEQQYLGAADLQQVVEYGRIARARHDLGGHSWGIVMGLQLTESSNTGSGQREVFIQPGYAWDGFGRPIIVLAPTKLSAGLFRSIPFDAAQPNGALVDIWVRYRETPTNGPLAGFETCEAGNQFARVVETFEVVIGERRTHAEQHDEITVGGRSDDAANVLQIFGGSSQPQIEDESVPHQTFPEDWGGALWLVPVGRVRWKPNASAGLPGTFEQRDAADLEASERFRRHAGLIGETVNAARNFLRLRRRTDPYEPAVRSDDLVWCEGPLRVSGNTTLLAGALRLRLADNSDGGVPLTISRAEANATGGRDLIVQIGTEENGDNRLAIGPLVGDPPVLHEKLVVRDNACVGIGVPNPDRPLVVRARGPNEELIGFQDPNGDLIWHINQHFGGDSGFNFVESGVADGRLYIAAGGGVGVDTVNPTNKLHVVGNLGVRQNRMYLSGGDAWSSLTYNAHHNAANSAWVFPDQARPAVTIEMDDANAIPRFAVYNTSAAAPTTWVQRLFVDGTTGSVHLAHNGGNIGIGTANPLNRLHVVQPDHLNVILDSSAFNEHLTAVVGSLGCGLRFSESNFFFIGSEAYGNRNSNGTGSEHLRITSGGRVGIGTTAPSTRLHIEGTASGSNTQFGSHLVVMDNRTQSTPCGILAMRMDVNNPGQSGNFITFFDSNEAIGAIEGNSGGTITLDITSADYAEWLPVLDGEDLAPADIVGVFGGSISHRTDGADHVLAVSTAPAVLGNRPASEARHWHRPVAFIGQVPVKVRGAVELGDVILASGDDDGVGVAQRADALASDDVARVVGVAWQASREAGVKTIRTALGVPALKMWARLLRTHDQKVSTSPKKTASGRRTGRSR